MPGPAPDFTITGGPSGPLTITAATVSVLASRGRIELKLAAAWPDRPGPTGTDAGWPRPARLCTQEFTEHPGRDWPGTVTPGRFSTV